MNCQRSTNHTYHFSQNIQANITDGDEDILGPVGTQLLDSGCLVIWSCHKSTTSSTAQGGGGSFKNRKPIGEVGCCESGMAERIHRWTERCLRSPLFRSLSLTIYLPTYLSIFYVSIYLSIYISLSLFHLSICLSV